MPRQACDPAAGWIAAVGRRRDHHAPRRRRGEQSSSSPRRYTVKAVVMAGGEGARLRPLTIARPKPMVPILNKPVMEHVLDLLKRHGITEVIVTLQYLASVVQDHFADGSSCGMDIKYAVQETPLRT